MKTNILKGHDFILGVEEDWNSYYEVKVKFIEEVSVDIYTYHLFKDQKNGNYFYISPRYKEHQIEGVFAEQRIIVNIFKGSLDILQEKNIQPEFYATGILKLPKQ